MTSSVREAFDRGTTAFNAHDIDGFAESFTEDAVLTAPGGVRAEGRAACLGFFGVWLEAFPDARVEVDRVIVAEDGAVEEGTFAGTHTGVLRTPQGDIPPTGRAVSVRYMQALRYRDGRFFSWHLIYDRLGLTEQLGLVPEPAAG
jgi:predicted ester cyclase